jgi:GH18 family chitinase
LCGVLSSNDWKREWLEKQAVPFAIDYNQRLIFYDDLESITAKVAYTKSRRLGGVSIWSLDLDDLNGVFCMQGEMPMTKNVKECLEQEIYVYDSNQESGDATHDDDDLQAILTNYID